MGQAGSAQRRNDIGDILHENMLGAGQFIAKEVFPPLMVDEQDGRFDKLAFGEIDTVEIDDLGGDHAESNEITHEYTTDNYQSTERKLKTFTSKRSNGKMPSFDMVLDDAKIVMYQLMRKWEKRVADIVFDVSDEFSSYTTAVGTAWSTSATATPVKDVQTAIQSLVDQMNGLVDGVRLVGIGNGQARIDLRACTDIKDRWVNTSGKDSGNDLSDAQLANILGLDAVYFSRLQTDGSQIWNTDRFGIYLVSDSQSIKSAPRVGNTLVWKTNSPSMWNVDTWEWTDPDGIYTRVQTDSVEKLLTARAGHVLTNVD